MTGIGTTSELQDVYRLIDVSVLTSKSEGFPNVVMEAMASGTPVVAANVGGVPELIRHGVTGTLIDDREPKSFADAIEYFLDHADVATEVADRAYKYVCEDLSLDAMVSGYKKVYDGLKSYLEESSMRCFRLAGALTLILYGVGAAGQAIDYSQYLGEHWYGLYITGKKAGYSMSLVTADEAGVVTVVEDATFKLNMAG
ncbi:MAG: glycosyltransferase family 4 protein, partial [Candidatus Hydrogenedentota bacterium]